MDKPITTTIAENFAQLGASSPESGTVALIVCRPEIGEREVLDSAELDTVQGMIGDNWYTRGSRHTDDGNAHPDMQITLMNSRVIQAIEPDRARWPLAGDQFFVDFDLSAENMPAGQRFTLGTAVLEVSPLPHTGCAKFTSRFGRETTQFVNSKEGRAARRRGINARVVQSGTVKMGDTIKKINP